jgi:RNA polymerase-binding transcription factor DksA
MPQQYVANQSSIIEFWFETIAVAARRRETMKNTLLKGRDWRIEERPYGCCEETGHSLPER